MNIRSTFFTTAASLLAAGFSFSAQAQFYTEGHADISVSLDAQNQFKIQWKFDRATVDGQLTGADNDFRPIADYTAVTDATFTRPSPDAQGLYAGMGVAPGESVFYFPVDNSVAAAAKVPFLGWSNEIDNGILVGDRVKIELTGLRRVGPGNANFSAWSIPVFNPEFAMRSDNGFGSDDFISLKSHSHYNLGLFSTSTPGGLIASFRATADLQAGGSLSKDFDVKFLACQTGTCPDDQVQPTPAPALGDMQRGLMLFGLLALAGLGLATPGRFRFA